ncbi:MAG: methylphosphotriester-DNA--protein-cysteine methyltransferase family protein, partial [Myxococcales bacterium]|nr:methylphosphotriester-DNA--protein-cysteine methyltransferase family protein [Myxococcales bacterium]
MNASCRDPAPDDADAAEVVASPLDADACYAALVARDRRFDGRFVVAVSTTGVYCRPVCRVRTPGRDRCSFFRRGAEAEAAGYRACLRCRPELAPRGIGVDDVVSRLVAAAVRRIEAGALNDDAAGDGGSGSGSASVDALADRLGVSARHLRRAMKREIGVTPVELAQSTRVALAKALLQDTRL